MYKAKVSTFDDTKASVLGDYVPAKLGFDEGEEVTFMVHTTDYKGYMLYFFENGKAAKVPLNVFETKTNRKKLAKAYSDKSKVVKMMYLPEDTDVLLRASTGKAVAFNTVLIAPKVTRDTQGVQAITLRKNAVLESVAKVEPDMQEQLKKYYVKNIPAVGINDKDIVESGQLEL